jgi:ATP-dependent RNA helicase DeaD
LGFSKTFPIQAQAIEPLLNGRDVIGQAKTGTGKTAAYGIPMLERLAPDDYHVQGLVLVPTRELAVQVAGEINRIGKHTRFNALPIYGGQSILPQIRDLKRGVQIVVGTPGRIIDHLERGTLRLNQVKMLVLDEADRMLDMGFIEDIEFILNRTPRERQTCLFSATMPHEIIRLSRRYLKDPEEIIVSKDEIAIEEIDQSYYLVDNYGKFDILCDLLNDGTIHQAIIFCKTKWGTARLADMLRSNHCDAEEIHGDLSQAQRDRVMSAFRKGRIQLLVATDLASRGLDITGVSHVINYDLPLDPLSYFHRIGRTARAGGSGTAITFVTYGEQENFHRILNLTKTSVRRMN